MQIRKLCGSLLFYVGGKLGLGEEHRAECCLRRTSGPKTEDVTGDFLMRILKEEDEVGGACSTHGIHDNCSNRFGDL